MYDEQLIKVRDELSEKEKALIQAEAQARRTEAEAEHSRR